MIVPPTVPYPPLPRADALVDPRVGDAGPAMLALEDGTVFAGIAFGAPVASGGDLVVNTSQTGYQEIATDPSYAGQVVVMTYPLIGNYGRLEDEDQSERPWLRGLVVAHATAAVLDDARQLATLLRDNGIPAIAGIDTRALARHLRASGCLRGIITPPGITDRAVAVAMARGVARWEDQDFVAQVSPSDVRELGDDPAAPLVAIVDYGLKTNIVLGICLGHQIVARAAGAETSRLRFGHHGANHPVQDLDTGYVQVTAQNHEVQVVGDTLPASSGFRVSQLNLNDRSVEGLRHAEKPIETVQYHPEGAPGPLDALAVFDRFADVCGRRA